MWSLIFYEKKNQNKNQQQQQQQKKKKKKNNKKQKKNKQNKQTKKNRNQQQQQTKEKSECRLLQILLGALRVKWLRVRAVVGKSVCLYAQPSTRNQSTDSTDG